MFLVVVLNETLISFIGINVEREMEGGNVALDLTIVWPWAQMLIPYWIQIFYLLAYVFNFTIWNRLALSYESQI